MTMLTIDADEVRDELPAWWSVENDGATVVHGSCDGGDPMLHPNEVIASFTIERADRGGLWRAQWCKPNDKRGGVHAPVASECGVKERVVSWVAAHAEHLLEGIDHGDDEAPVWTCGDDQQ